MTSETKLSEFAANYVMQRDVSEHYAKQVLLVARSISKFLGREATISDLNEEQINAWLFDLKSQKLSAATRRFRRTVAKVLARDASRRQIVAPLNPDLLVHIKPVPIMPTGFSRDEAQRIVLAVMEPKLTRHQRWLAVEYSTGIVRRQWWTAYLLACWDTGAPADLRRLPWQSIDNDGYVSTLRHKTGKRLQWQFSEATMRAINEIRDPRREMVFPLWSSLWAFRMHAKHVITVVAGMEGRSLGEFRSGAGTDVESVYGKGHELLGNTRAIFEKHYKVDRLMPRSAVAPRPLLK